MTDDEIEKLEAIGSKPFAHWKLMDAAWVTQYAERLQDEVKQLSPAEVWDEAIRWRLEFEMHRRVWNDTEGAVTPPAEFQIPFHNPYRVGDGNG